MKFEILLTPHVWLQVSPEIRNTLIKEFGMKRSTTPRCVTERGITRVESDGFTVEDLKALNVESMQKWLGFSTIDDSADLNSLLLMVVHAIEKRSEVVEDKVEVPPVDKFCAFCDSKGVRHLKVCTRPL